MYKILVQENLLLQKANQALILDLRVLKKVEARQPEKKTWIVFKIFLYFVFTTSAILGAFFYVSAKTQMSASVNGWYEVVKRDNSSINLTTNMQVWINGTKVK